MGAQEADRLGLQLELNQLGRFPAVPPPEPFLLVDEAHYAQNLGAAPFNSRPCFAPGASPPVLRAIGCSPARDEERPSSPAVPLADGGSPPTWSPISWPLKQR